MSLEMWLLEHARCPALTPHDALTTLAPWLRLADRLGLDDEGRAVLLAVLGHRATGAERARVLRAYAAGLAQTARDLEALAAVADLERAEPLEPAR